MSIDNGFNDLPRAVQVILLVVPGVNWIVEILVRWSAVLGGRGGKLAILWATLASLFGIVLGYVDAVFCIAFKHLVFFKKECE